MEENSIYQRTEILIGKENVEILKQKHILICGIGGVGSYTLEAAARIGIGKITIIDKDNIDITNINRQIIALSSTIGESKVDVAKKRVYDINKNIDITSINEVITKDNISNIITDELDYVVDAVDNMEAKIAIITECDKKKIKCISCMGVGNKLNPLDIKVDDIYNTCVCPLAKRVRKQLKSIGIKNLKVIYSIESPKINCENNAIGSVSFVPSVAGLVIASEIVKDFMVKN